MTTYTAHDLAYAKGVPEPVRQMLLVLQDRLAEKDAENKVLMVSANALVHQIYIGDFVDSHGHSAKMLSAAIDLKNLLEQRND